MSNLLLSKHFNVVAFNLIWLGCVVGREQYWWAFAPVVLGYLALLVQRRIFRVGKFLMLFGLGVGIDSLLTVLGVFQFGPTIFFIPLWLVLLWAAFTTTLFLSLEIVGRNKWIAAICGALAFPFNYAVGESLGAVSFGMTDNLTLAALSTIWTIVLPAMFWLAENNIRQTDELA